MVPSEFKNSILERENFMIDNSFKLALNIQQLSISFSYLIYSFFAENEEEEGLVIVRLLSLPYERFVRNIVKTEMDLFSK